VTRKEDSLLYWYDVSRGRGHEWENAMDAAAPSPQAQAQQAQGLTDEQIIKEAEATWGVPMKDSPQRGLLAAFARRVVERELRASTAAAPSPVPAGFKLLQDTTHAQRSWPEDASHENGNYSCCCCHCLRMFTANKRRVVCKVCAAAPGAPTPAPKGTE
jgi:predicted ArsR family transcriptional regulator